MENDLISRSALLKELDGVKEPSVDTGGTVKAEPVLNLLIELTKCVVESIPAVDAVPVEKLGKWGKLFVPYKGCPRGHVGRMGLPATLEDEALYWGVITDVDGGRWVPVVEGVLRELIAKSKAITRMMANEVRLIDAYALEKDMRAYADNKAYCGHIELANGICKAVGRIDLAPTIDPESLRPKGHWNIRCESHRDNWTGEVDEEFYLECSECKRQVWDIDYMAAQNDDHQKFIERYPYCHCGCKMEAENGAEID